MAYLIAPLCKSPHASGRIGPRRAQDWYRVLVLAVRLYKQLPGSRVLVTSNLKIKNEVCEADLTRDALLELGIPANDIIVVREGVDTLEQLAAVERTANERGEEPIFISTPIHYPRIRWILWGTHGKHRVAFGIPRPKEALTDMALNIIYPLLDLCGGRDWFSRRVEARRARGIL